MYIRVFVQPNSKKEKIEQLSFDRLSISVREKAERNLANNRMLEILTAFFCVPRHKVRLITGHHSQNKIISVDNE